MTESFKITPRVIAHLGEALIKNETIALLELVKNSYDAMANECEVYFYCENNILSRIVITDNGSGMDLDTIENKWLVIGTDNKKKQFERDKKKKNTRLPLGEKGIGRLGVHKLGHVLHMTTKTKNGDEIVLDIDWKQLEKVNKIEEFAIVPKILKTPKEFKNKTHGTKIEISSLKMEWDRKKIRDIYRSLLSLNSPFENTSDTFKVLINSNTNLFYGLPTFEEVKKVGMYYAHCTLEGSKVIDFNYSFEPWNTLDRISEGRKITIEDLKKQEFDLSLTGFHEIELEDGRTKEEKYEIDLAKSKIGTVNFDIIIFEPDTQIINYMNLEKKSFRDYMKSNGGIRIYRDNVRIYNYGEPDDDWLGINEKRIHRVGSNIGNQIVLGAVRLNRAESIGLEEKTNREGFVENESYFDLVNAINCVLSKIVLERNIDKATLSSLYKKEKITEPVISDLRDVKVLIEEKVKNEEDKKEIVKYINRIDEQYVNVRNTLLSSANVGINLGAIVHEIEKQVKMLKGNIIVNDLKRIKEISDRLDNILRKANSLLRKSDRKQQSLNKSVEKVLDGFKYRFEDHNIKLFYNFDSKEITSFFSESAVNSSLTNLLDNSIYWLTYVRRTTPKISVYITNQLRDYNCIIVSDNGPGFSIPESIATQPFISGKPNNMGTGLGLHICNEMMKANDGKLEFCEENEYNLPKIVIDEKITKAFVVLCLPKKNVI